MTEAIQSKLIYFADPMCSWCWGFTPVIQHISREYKHKIPIQMIMGGLYAGNTQVMDEISRKEIRRHWQHVHEASGQSFNYDFFDREQFIYDTELPCRALIASHSLKPESVLWFLHHLQQAFYRENQDITAEAVLIDLAVSFGLDKNSFEEKLNDAEIKRITQLNFDYTRYLGVTGFPTLVAQSAQGNHFITRGYQSLDSIRPVLEKWENEVIKPQLREYDNPPSGNTGNPGG